MQRLVKPEILHIVTFVNSIIYVIIPLEEGLSVTGDDYTKKIYRRTCPSITNHEL